jgi:hypothetical protein
MDVMLSILKNVDPYMVVYMILYKIIDNEQKYTKEERELLSFFTDQFHIICNRLTVENISEMLDDFRELRDDCQILKKRGHAHIKPFRIIASGEVIGFESTRRPPKHEGFISCEL